MRYVNDNIVAIASANGYAGVGVIRISGTNLNHIIYELTKRVRLKPRYAHLCDLWGGDGVLDHGLVLYFPGPNSFTGEDVLELHGHGSPLGLNLLLKRCLELGCRLAEAGEFSKRAYLNGKIDLVQAESIADLIHAKSEAGVKGALKSLKGQFSNLINEFTQELINLRMFVEASLDFPEEDIEFIADAKIYNKLSVLKTKIHQLQSSTQQGVILNNGANIVIIGRPNVGKSSLLNALANEEVAIVTDIPGTTRDIVRQSINIAGIPFNIIDTAGIRSTSDVVEQIGIKRAIAALNDADLAMIILDDSVGITNSDREILQQLPVQLNCLYVHNKIDLSGQIAHSELKDGETHIYLAARSGDGVAILHSKLLELIGWDSGASDVFLARTRHLEALRQTVIHLDHGFVAWRNLEILAEELRYAHNALSVITGEFSADDLLGEIFTRFCIGK